MFVTCEEYRFMLALPTDKPVTGVFNPQTGKIEYQETTDLPNDKAKQEPFTHTEPPGSTTTKR